MNVIRFDRFWQVVSPIFEAPRQRGRPSKHTMKHIVKAIIWILDTGSQWHNLPKEFPYKSTVHYWHQKWSQDGTYESVAKT